MSDAPVPSAAEPGFRPTREHVRGRALPIRILGSFSSLRSAATLIIAIAIVIGVATYYERAYGRHAASVVIYHSWWFAALWSLIALNIFGAAAVRYPWRRRQLGFVVVHLGLLTLILGFFLSWGRLDGMLDAPTGQEASIIQGERDRLIVVDGSGAGARSAEVFFDAAAFGGFPSFPRFVLNPVLGSALPSLKRGDPLRLLLTPDTWEGFWHGAKIARDFPRIAVTGCVLWGGDSLIYGPGYPGDPAAVGFTLRLRPPGEAEQTLSQIWLADGGSDSDSVGPFNVALGRTRYTTLAESLLAGGEAIGDQRILVVHHAGGVERLTVGTEFPQTADINPALSVVIERMVERPRFDGQQLQDDDQAGLDPLLIVRIGEGIGSERRWRMVPVFACHPASQAVYPDQAGAECIYEHPVLRSGGSGQGLEVYAVRGPDGSIVATAFSRQRGRLPGARVVDGETKIWPLPLGAMLASATVTNLQHARQEPRPIMVAGKDSEAVPRWIEVEASRGTARGRAWLARDGGGADYQRIRLDDGSEVLLRYGRDLYDLKKEHQFSVVLKRFIERRDPGGERVAGYESEIEILRPGQPPESRRVVMNEPVTCNGVALYQSSFDAEVDEHGRPIPGRYRSSVFTAATDPGRFCKYLGSLILVLGMILIAVLNRRLPVTRPT